MANSPGAWCHQSIGNVNELARGSTLGSTGWSAATDYAFKLDYTATSLTFAINGVEQFALNGSFGNGGFGFYGYSQDNVRYSGVTVENLQPPAVPEPATWAMLIAGFGLAGGTMRRTARAKATLRFA